ncbi:unnamed protein product [Urochloa humidicola]
MVWLGMILAMIWAQSVQWWSEWGFRVAVLSSLVANLLIGFLSGTRRRSAPGLLWGFLGQLAKFLLWLAYQVAEVAAASAIGSLSLCGRNASEEEKQVVAFWGTFLLLHLGGPDNLTAYALEDNKMSNRKWLEIITKILVLIYTIKKNTHSGGRSRALLTAASIIKFLTSAISYCERAKALEKANLNSMQDPEDNKNTENNKNTQHDAASTGSSKDDDGHKFKFLKCRIQTTKRLGRWFRDGQALLLAQDLFPVWRHALVDSSVDPDSERQRASEMILSESNDWDWDSMCKVAEMELSLIYEFLYTKAILAHNWHYYLIRLVSPICTAAAAFLFNIWLQQHLQVRGSFVKITYAFLAVTFLMDVAWLLRTLGSTWAYAYLREKAPAWLHQQALHRARGRSWWHSLHHIVVRLDPLQLFDRDPVSHRRWSGTIGRYNLLDECTAATIRTVTHPSHSPEWWPLSQPEDTRPKEMRYLCKLPHCVKELLFKRVIQILQDAITKEEERHKLKDEKQKNMYTREDIRTSWGQKAFRNVKFRIKLQASSEDKDKDEDLEKTMFGKEFEEDVLLWHIATCMILPHIGQQRKHRLAIEVMSEYMMFLVAVRRQMLPGLVLHSQLQVTRVKLVEIWNGGKRVKSLLPNLGRMADKEKFAMLLRRVRREKPRKAEEQWVDGIPGSEGTRVLAQAVDLYFKLSGDKPRGVESRDTQWPSPEVPDEMLEFIFNVWVDKLVYAAVRCSREAHAEQLRAGGDLTTVLWMLIQHAGPFCMGEAIKLYIYGDAPPPIPPPSAPSPPPHFPAPPAPEPQPSSQPPTSSPPQAPDRPPHVPPSSSQPPSSSPPQAPAHPHPLAGFAFARFSRDQPSGLPWPFSFLADLLSLLADLFAPAPSYCCPMCPPYSHPSYPDCPVFHPYYDPSWPPACPCYAQCPPQHEMTGDEPEQPRENEHEDSASDEGSEE